MEQTTGLVLAALLDEPLCRDVRLCDPAADLAVPVRWCLPLTEALLANEPLTDVLVFVGASGPDLDADTVATLVAKGVVTVMIREEQPLSECTLRVASNRGLITMVAGKGVDYSRLGQLIAQKALTPRAHVLEYGIVIHKTMAELLYRGAGLTAMTQQLSRLSGCAVFLMDTHLETLAYESVSVGAVPDPSEVSRLIREAVHTGQLSESSHKQVKAVTITLTLEDGPVVCVICPIVLGGNTYGWLTLVELDTEPKKHDLAQHFAIAEHGATVTGSEMLRLRSVSEAEERARGDFVHALLHGRFTNSHELAARAEHHQFDTGATYGVIVATGASNVSPAGIEQQWNLARSLHGSVRAGSRWTMATTVGDLLAVVRQLSPAGEPHDTNKEQEELATFTRDLDRDLREQVGSRLRLAYGRPGVSAVGVARSYRDARMTLGVAAHVGLARVCGYPELRVFTTLSGLATSAQGTEFARDVLAPLRRNDSAGDKLERVVMTYVHSGGNLNATARTLHMHRNTVLYKLSRASRLLNMDLHEAENRFTLWLAHRLDLLGHVEGAVSQEVDVS